MEKTIRNILFLSISMFLACSEGLAIESGAAEKEIKKLEREILAAHVMLDYSLLERVYADEYKYISDDGTVFTKKQVVEMVKTAAFRLDSIPVSNSHVKLFGTTALLTGVRKFYRGGKMLLAARYTEVWLNKNQRWQCVSGQLTPLL